MYKSDNNNQLKVEKRKTPASTDLTSIFFHKLSKYQGTNTNSNYLK